MSDYRAGNRWFEQAWSVPARGRHVLAMTLICICLASCRETVEKAPAVTSNAPVKKPGAANAATDNADSRSPDHAGASLFGNDLEPTPVGGTGGIEHRTRFAEVAAESGIEFTYDTGTKGQSLMVESTGGGCGWLDYDGDGRWDLYLVQGGDPTLPPSPSQPADRLYRNLGESRLLDITERCLIDERGYGQGTAIADFDGDGFDDIFVTNVGRNVLYRNRGDGTFSETETQTFGAESRWSSSAAWGDIDRDGDLDLYVARYVLYDPANPKPCTRKSGEPGTCHPKEVEPCPDECYLNEGDGTFRPVAQERGLVGPNNRALGVAIADFDNDGWPDIFVANDTTENFLFVNQRDGTFQELAQILGCAVNINGSTQANMGIAVGDYDRNGFLDLYITHFHKEWNTLYQNLGENGFHDVTAAAQLSGPTMDQLGWGTVMADFDQNGYEELFTANGHIDDLRSQGIGYQMTTQLFAFNGSTWDDCNSAAGPFFQQKILGRAVASCDFDDDGDLDIALVAQNSPAALLRNESRRGHWLKLSFVGPLCNRRGIGTRVTVRCGDKTLVQELAGGTSYCASHQPILLFGLGEETGPCDLEIHWPGGAVQKQTNVKPDQWLVARQAEIRVPLQP